MRFPQRRRASAARREGAGAVGESEAEGDPPSRDASADGGKKRARLQPNKHREVQAARTAGRKLFGAARKQIFLNWFAATANLGWAAEKAGVCRQTVAKHLTTDPEFRADYDAALETARRRLLGKMLETKKPEPRAGDAGDGSGVGEAEIPDIDIPFDKALAILREMKREATVGRKHGRTPTIAPNGEVMKAVVKRAQALWRRVQRRKGVAGGSE